MRLDGLLGDHEPRGDLLVRQPARDQHQHLPLPRRERVERGRRRHGAGLAGEVRDQPAGHGRRQQRLPRGDHAYRGHQLVGGGVLEQEPARARPQRGVDVVVHVERRQHRPPGRASPCPAAARSPRRRRAPASARPSAPRPARPRRTPPAPPAPSAACPTTSMPSCASSSAANPARTMSWSSTTTTLITGPPPGPSHRPAASPAPASRRRAGPPRRCRRAASPARAGRPARARRRRLRGPGRALVDHLDGELPGPRRVQRDVPEMSSEMSSEMSTVAGEPGACRTTLDSASCTIRYADSWTASGSPATSPVTVSRTGVPAAVIRSTSSPRSASVGCGASAGASCSSRSAESSPRSSVSEPRASFAMPVNSATDRFGQVRDAGSARSPPGR